MQQDNPDRLAWCLDVWSKACFMHLQVASCVQQIQNELPMARVVYCSATGVSEVGNMAFMNRLVCTSSSLLSVTSVEYRQPAVAQPSS